MSLRKRRLLAAVLCLLAALCLSYGFLMWRAGDRLTGDTVSTTTPPIVEATDQYGNPVPIDPHPRPGSDVDRIQAWIGLIMLAIGAGLTVAIPFLLKNQPAGPLLGPDVESCLLIVSLYATGTFFEYIHTKATLTLFVCFLLTVLDLILLYSIISWLRRRLSLDWLTVHRISDFFRRRAKAFWLYPTVLFALSIASLGISLWVYRLYPYRTYYDLALLLGLITTVSCGACLIRYFRDTDHLLYQIHALPQNRQEDPQKGLFREDEALLLEMQTQREEAIRQAVAGERFKVELIANVSHDLRTPLTAILGYSELLGKEPLSAEAAGWLTQLNQRSGYMQDLVDSLFELTKVSSGVLEAKHEDIDLIRLMEQTLGLLDDKLLKTGLEVRRHYCADTLPICTDGARLHQVFANLVENAAKYALTGTRLYVDITEDAEKAQVRMTNTASYEMNFRPEDIVRRFARGDQARTTKGSGLGLAIAQTYTESVGGTFHVEIDGDQFRSVVTLPKS